MGKIIGKLKIQNEQKSDKNKFPLSVWEFGWCLLVGISVLSCLTTCEILLTGAN